MGATSLTILSGHPSFPCREAAQSNMRGAGDRAHSREAGFSGLGPGGEALRLHTSFGGVRGPRFLDFSILIWTRRCCNRVRFRYQQAVFCCRSSQRSQGL